MSCQVTIVSYDMLPKFQLIGKFNCAIADESHFIKNREFGKSSELVYKLDILLLVTGYED